jgi:hypothetical protein
MNAHDARNPLPPKTSHLEASAIRRTNSGRTLRARATYLFST